MQSCPGLSVCFSHRRYININLAVSVSSEGSLLCFIGSSEQGTGALGLNGF